MTTIAYKNGTLASDSRVTKGGTIIADTHRKVHRLRDGSLLAWAGSVQDSEVMLKHLRKSLEVPLLNDIEALMVRPDGSVELFEGSMWVKQKKAPHYALGSGDVYALAAMDAGASAKRAVQIAINRDTSSGGRVQTARLK